MSTDEFRKFNSWPADRLCRRIAKTRQTELFHRGWCPATGQLPVLIINEEIDFALPSEVVGSLHAVRLLAPSATFVPCCVRLCVQITRFSVTVRLSNSFTEFDKKATNAGDPVHYAHQLVHILWSVWKAQVVEHESDLAGSATHHCVLLHKPKGFVS